MKKADLETYDYFVFGRRLRSQLELPDLSPAPPGGPPHWELRLDYSEPPAPIVLLGSREIAPDWVYRLHRVENGLRLEYGGIGSFGIFAAGREIVWYPGSEPEDAGLRLEMARAILLGPTMALALHQLGVLCLHGAAVTIREEAVAFLAPKFHGKSTLALALTAAGARLLTDDLVAIDRTPSPVVLPGIHSVRVLTDIAERLGPRFSEATLSTGLKTTVTNLPRQDLAWEPAPLAAIYLIEPSMSFEGELPPVSREALPRTRAAASLAHQKKLTDELVGLADAGSMLESIASVVSTVPVYRLDVVRDLERLPEVVREVMAWHGAIVAPQLEEGGRR
jgi:hypothetical protein